MSNDNDNDAPSPEAVLRKAQKHVAPFVVVTADCRELNVVVGGSADNAAGEFASAALRALRAGHVVEHDDGRRVWRERHVDFDPEAERASQQFIWHEDGRRVRCTWFECSQRKAGEPIERKRLRSVWVDYFKV